mgnify:CR=1 FL=1
MDKKKEIHIEDFQGIDIKYTLLDSFIRVMQGRLKDYERAFPYTAEVEDKIISDVLLFAKGFSKNLSSELLNSIEAELRKWKNGNDK